MKNNRSIYTASVHAGSEIKEHFGASSTPVFNASLYRFTDADEGAAVHNLQKPGYYYGRLGNPTTGALENAISELESAESAVATGSGMSAIAAVFAGLLKSGDHVVLPASRYSTTGYLLNHLSDHFNVEFTYVDATSAANYRAAARENTKLFWIESPSNPLLNITDIAEVASFAHEAGIIAAVDNTFATPFNQSPLALGADLVVHSATKYLGGHSDLTAGLLAGRADLVQKAREVGIVYFGGSIAPQVAWLVLRGIKTLALRMERHNNNAYAIANMLNEHPSVKAVFYPGLESHKNHEIAKTQMKGFGGMVSFDVGGAEEAKRFLNALDLVAIATSLGGVETIAQHSASMTHAGLSPEERAKAGISDGLIRMSVGIEDPDEIAADLKQAIERI